MKKVIIALVFLVLISLPIAASIPTAKTLASSDPVPIVSTVTLLDPSTLPKSDAVTSPPLGVAQTYNVYPYTTSLNTYYTVSGAWYDVPVVAILAPQATGHYDFFVYIYITNPSYKWACACFAPYVLPTPNSIISSSGFFGFVWGIPTNSYLKPVASNITWSGQNLFVWRVEIVADVSSTSGVFNVNMPFNQMHTDITGPNGVPDGVVNMRDVALVINHYGTAYQPNQDRTQAWNIVLDYIVDYNDIIAVAVEFQRTIPP